MPISRWTGAAPPTLRGIILRSESRERVIVQASAAEVAAFTARDGDAVEVAPRELRVIVGGPAPYDFPAFATTGHLPASAITEMHERADVDDLMRDGFLYNRHGRAVARVVSVEAHVDSLDVTDMGDIVTRYMQGRRHVSISAVGL